MSKYLTASMLAFVTTLLTISPKLSSSSSTSKDDDQDPNQCCRLSTNPNDVKFLLFPDERNPDYYTEIIFNDVESLANSLFQPGIQTILITHGFRSDFNSPSCKNPKGALLQYGPGPSKANIIVATWGPLSTPFPLTFSLNWYTHVLENVPIVGERIGDFIKFLVEQKVVGLDQIYLIGHSLGAHVTGIAGKQVQKTFGNNQKVGRITGLDPTLVGKWPEDDSLNLMKGDSSFVDVIHTNAGKLGMIGQCGHADFYPNGGSHQPGCEIGDHGTPNTLPGSCSHEYSHILYANSVIKNFLSCPCDPFTQAYSAGTCSVKCNSSVAAIMGFNCVSTTRGEFYLETPDIHTFDTL